MTKLLLTVFVAVTCIGVDAQPVSDLQIQIEQARVRQMQTDAEIARIQAETERMRLATERLRAARTSQETADTIRPVQNWFNTNEPDKAQKAAEEALDAIKNEMNRAAVKNSNNIFMTVILAFAILFGINISRRISGVVQVNYQQRFGVTVMVCAFMMTILAVVISDGWYPNVDVIQNILVSIRIQLLKDADTYPYNGYMIDIPTKYVLLACIAAGAYGYMTFLGVAPAWKRKTPDPVVPSIPSDQE